MLTIFYHCRYAVYVTYPVTFGLERNVRTLQHVPVILSARAISAII